MKLLFVCSGNICRSPMAEILSVHLADQMGVDVDARSAGTLELKGRPAHKHAIAVCNEMGLDLSRHRSQGVTEALVEWADHILVMERQHAIWVTDRFSEAAGRVHLLGGFDGKPEIPDPIGGWKWTFRRCRKRITRCLEVFLHDKVLV